MTKDTRRQWTNLQAALVAHQQTGGASYAVQELLASNYRWHYVTLGERYILCTPHRRTRLPEHRFFRCPLEAQRAFLAASRARGRVNLDSAAFELCAIEPDGRLRRLARSYGERRSSRPRDLALFR